MIKLSIVSYLNALPFLNGLEFFASELKLKIEKDNPAECARKLINGDVQIGLVPVAAIPQISDAQIITDYCIGANGPVRSVCLLSNIPKEKIRKIYLDPQSRTSNLLMQVIAKKFWQSEIDFVFSRDVDFNEQDAAFIIIGDRAFKYKSKFKYVYDLSEEWKENTGLPFVFACWIANKPISKAIEDKLNESFKYGVSHIDEEIPELNLKLDSGTTIESYLKKYISYKFDDEKRQALELFTRHNSEIQQKENFVEV